jgi:hypothetical protein
MVLAFFLVLVLGGGLGWWCHSRWQPGAPVPAKEENDPELIAKQEKAMEEARQKQEHRKIIEFHERVRRLNELVRNYEKRLKRLTGEKKAIEQEMGSADSGIVAV